MATDRVRSVWSLVYLSTLLSFAQAIAPPGCVAPSAAPANFNPNVEFFDGNCDVPINTGQCLYDQGNCCLTGLLCADPGSPNFNPDAERCMNCIDESGFVDFCSYYKSSIFNCLRNFDNCQQGFFYESQLDSFRVFVREDLCNQQPGCSAVAETVSNCVVDAITLELLPAVTDNQTCLAVDSINSCFEGTACVSTVTEAFALGFVGRAEDFCNPRNNSFDVAACEASFLPSVFGPVVIFDPARVGDQSCDYNLNTPECAFDGGDCCRTFPDPASFRETSCLQDNAYPNFATCHACLNVAPLSLATVTTDLCPFITAFTGCLQATPECAGPVLTDAQAHPSRELNDVINFDQVFCQDPACQAGVLYECVLNASLLLQSSAGEYEGQRILSGFEAFTLKDSVPLGRELQAPTCDFIDAMEACHAPTGCNGGIFLQLLQDFNLFNFPLGQVLPFCRECTGNLTAVADPGNTGCLDFTFTASLNLPASCASTLDNWSGIPGASNQFNYTWMLSPAQGGSVVNVSGATVNFDPFALGGTGVVITLFATSIVIPELVLIETIFVDYSGCESFVPPDCEAKVDDFYSNAPPLNVTLQDANCDQINNLPECGFDRGVCCQTGTRCIDPSSPLFNATAAACAACNVRQQGQSFCDFYQGAVSCWAANSCDRTFSFDVIPNTVMFGALDLCRQTASCVAVADTAHDCLFQQIDTIQSLPPVQGVFCPAVEAILQTCYASACSDQVILSFLASEVSGGVVDLCLNRSSVDVAQCEASRIGSPLPELTTDPLDGEDLADNSCDVSLNTPECGFDQGDCCLASSSFSSSFDPPLFVSPFPSCIEKNAYPKIDACMACLTNAPPFNPSDLAGTACPWANSAAPCLTANQCGSLETEQLGFFIATGFAIFLEDACGDPVCDVPVLFDCVRCSTVPGAPNCTDNSNSTGTRRILGLDVPEIFVKDKRSLQVGQQFCDTVLGIEQCVKVEGGCRPSVLVSLLDGAVTSATGFPATNDEVLAECFDCNNLELSHTQVGTKICEQMTLSGSAVASTRCIDAVTDYFADKTVLNSLEHSWNITFGFLASNLFRAETSQVFVGSSVQVNPFEIFALEDATVTYTVSSSTNSQVRGSQTFVANLSRTDPVSIMSATGTIKFLDDDLGREVLVDGLRSCIPDNIGCALCPPTGFAGTFPPGAEDVLIYTLTGFLAKDPGEVEPVLQSNEIYFYTNEVFGETRFENYYATRWVVSGSSDPGTDLSAGRYLLQATEMSLQDEPYGLEYVVINKVTFETVASQQLNIRFLNASAIVPEECEADTLNLYTLNDVEVTFFDQSCSLENNLANCSFDRDRCCDQADTCADPSSPNFNPVAAQCMSCLTRGDRSFCEFFTGLEACFDANNCPAAFRSYIHPNARFIADDLCAQTACGVSPAAEAVFDCLYAVSANSFDLPPDGCVAGDVVEICFAQAAPFCFDAVVKKFFEQNNALPRTDCDGEVSAVEVGLCLANTIASPLDLIEEFSISNLGNLNCDARLNVPQCNFDGGDCCNIQGNGGHLCMEDNAYVKQSACFACITNSPFDPNSIDFTFCPWLSFTQTCSQVNDCTNVTFNEYFLIASGPFADAFEPICDSGCRGGAVFECLATANITGGEGQRRLLDHALEPEVDQVDWIAADASVEAEGRRELQLVSCSTVVGFADCFLNTDCPKSEFYKLAGINETDLPFYVSACYGCVSGLAVTVSRSGDLQCRDVVFSVDFTVPTECNDALNALFDTPTDITNQFTFDWILEVTVIGRRLQQLQQSSGRTLVVKPFQLGVDQVRAQATVTSSVFSGLVGLGNLSIDLSTLQKTPVVPKTSEIGTIVLYSGAAGVPVFSINAFGSCVPDNIGCGLCSPSGFTGNLAASQAAILTQTGFTGDFVFNWTVSCQNPPCTVPDQVGPVFDIQNTALSLSNSPYTISLTITDNTDQSSVSAAPISVEVLDGGGIAATCNIPQVSIASTSAAVSFDPQAQAQVLVINEGQRGNVLIAELAESDGTPITDFAAAGISLEWQFLSNVVATGRAFPIEDDLLLQNPDPYTFTLFARQDCSTGADPFARLILNINNPPVNGTVLVNPASGETLNTKFQFTTSGWVDPENNLPLQYAFFADGSILRARSTSDTLSDIPLSGDGAIPTFVRVFDFLGAKTDSAPFFVTLTPIKVADIDLTVFADASRDGADEEALIDFVSVVIKAVNDDVNNTNVAEAAALRKAAFETLRDATASKRNQNVSTFEDAARAATSFKQVLSDPDQLSQDDFSDFAGFYNDLLEDTKQQDLNEGTGVEDQFFEDLLEGTSTLLSTLVSLGFGRRLQANSATCVDISSLRDVVKDVGLVVTKDDIAGAFVRRVNSSAIQLAAATTAGNEIGSLSFGDVNVSIPADIGAGTGEITTLLSQFNFNVRLCDDADVDLLAGIVSVEECVGTLNASGTEQAPVKPPENVISLEFRNSLAGGGEIAVEPTDLDEPIVLRLPLGNLDEDDSGICSNFTLLSCGFYSESAGGFRTDGCNVTDVDVVAGTLECTCNHASDYAAWVAFQQDVVDVFTKPLSIVTLFAVLLSSGIMLGVFATYCLCFMWGNSKDRSNARALQKEAVGMMVLNQFLMRQRQRQFFANLKEAVKQGKDPERVKPPEEVERKPRSLCNRIITAVQYEHSLLGLARYDPHYTRIQRVSIFIAVVVGNLFVAALFFELKDSEVDDLSPEFVILVVLISSLAVAVPIRLVIKMLFRLTDYQSGSSADRLAQLYRVSLEAELDFKLVMNNPKDVTLVRAFKDVYTAKARLRNLGVRVSDYRFGCCESEIVDDRKVEMELNAAVADEEEGEAQEEKPSSRRNQIAEAKMQLAEAKERLEKATKAAKEDWSQKANEEALERVKLVNRQKSRLMKAAALVSQDAAPTAKARRALCPSWMVYLSWTFLITLYGLSVFYVVRFILTRADRAASPTVTRTEEELIGVWLVSASLGIIIGYCVAEPLIAIIRYALLPYCITKCGNRDEEEDEEQAVAATAETEEKEEEVVTRPKSGPRINKEYGSVEIKQLVQAGEDEKKRGQQSRGQYFLEFLSDLIETIY